MPDPLLPRGRQSHQSWPSSQNGPRTAGLMPKLDPEYDHIPEDLPEDEDEDNDHPSLTAAERNPNLK